MPAQETGTGRQARPRRAVKTLLFTDIVGSTEHIARLQDSGWRDLLDRHDSLVCDLASAAGGELVSRSGDGLFFTFASPGAGVRCAEEADVACVVKQVGEQEWAVSMRSKGGVDVSRVAVALGGGGHRLAAGFTGRGTAQEIMAAIRRELNLQYPEDQG